MPNPSDWNKDFKTSCDIIDRLTELDNAEALADILRSVCAYNAEAAAIVVNYNSRILEEEL